MTKKDMDSSALIEAARDLAPLLRARAREAERARRPLDEVIDAVRESGLFALMVPHCYGGHEADLDTFFEVVLTLSRADPSMGEVPQSRWERNVRTCRRVGNRGERWCRRVPGACPPPGAVGSEPAGGVEPPTYGLQDRCSARLTST